MAQLKINKQQIKKNFDFLFGGLMQLGFEEIPLEPKLREVYDKKGLKRPKRATVDNNAQSEWRYVNKRTGLTVVVQTNFVRSKNDVSSSGQPWVNIVENKLEKRVFTRAFVKRAGKKNNMYKLLSLKLLAYAQFAKNIVDNKPKNRDLDRISDYKYVWRHKDDVEDVIDFDYKQYIGNLNEDSKRIISNKESGIRIYFPATQDKVDRGVMSRIRNTRTTW